MTNPVARSYMSAAKGGQEKKSVVVVEKVSRTLEQARAQSKVHETRS